MAKHPILFPGGEKPPLTPEILDTNGATAQDIQELAEKFAVDAFRLQFTDVTGINKNVEVPRSQFAKALAGDILFDGSSIEGFVRIEESDMLLKPELETFRILPYDDEGGRVARLICDIYHADNTPFAGCPRLALKRQVEKAADMGYVMMAGCEAEFFLFQLDENGRPSLDTHDEGGYFDLAPVDKAEPLRRLIIADLEMLGFEVEAGHHEVAHAQHEIDFKYADAVTTADYLATFRFIVRNVAYRHGFLATFMPKPIEGANGSGMHTHQSLWKDGEPLFFDESGYGQLSDTARWYIGGLLAHAKSILAFTNPTTNSYKRLVPGYEAPVTLALSSRNRSASCRIPMYSSSPKAKRIEVRYPDAAANPYLAFSAMLMAGLDGVENKTSPGEPLDKNIYSLTAEERAGIAVMPGSLEEALDCLEEDHDFLLKGDVFTDDAIRSWIDYKREEECEPVRLRPHPHEFELYYDI